jgi:Putative transposase, YhgA-like
MPMPTPHDRFFRHVFADPEPAEGELRTVLPAALTARIDWASLALLPSTVSRYLQELSPIPQERLATLARVLGCTDLDELERWVHKAVTAKTTVALFAAAKRGAKAGA